LSERRWLNRNPTHATALNACKAALSGEIEPETARSTFVAFARLSNRPVPDACGTIETRIARDRIGGAGESRLG